LRTAGRANHHSSRSADTPTDLAQKRATRQARRLSVRSGEAWFAAARYWHESDVRGGTTDSSSPSSVCRRERSEAA
jgi:hypothetical protein